MQGCSNYEKEYYENGQIKSIRKDYWYNTTVHEIIFSSRGDTLEINTYNRNGELDGQIANFSYDSVYSSKRIYNYENGTLEGEALELVKGHVRFKWYYKKGIREGKYTAYFQNGQIKWDGFIHNDELCYMNVYDIEGDLKESHNFFDYGIENISDKGGALLFWLDFTVINEAILGEEVLYAIFSITEGDTLKLTEELYLIEKIKAAKIEIPLVKLDSGKYYIKLAIPSVTNYEDSQMMYNLDFITDQNSNVTIVKPEMRDGFQLKW